MISSLAASLKTPRPRMAICCAQFKRTRYLLHVRDRADRLALRNRQLTAESDPAAQNDPARVRRLRRYIVRLDSGKATSAIDDAELSSRAARAVQHQVRVMTGMMVRVVAPAVLVALALSGLAVVLIATVAPLRERWFPTDLGPSAHWTASSHFSGTVQQGVGTPPAASDPNAEDAPFFFHTLHEKDPYIDLEFSRPVRLREVRIENRSDCCEEGALPLNVEIPGSTHPQILCQRRSPFRTWTCSVDGITTRRLRIRRPGISMLHLRRIEVYE